ncbi:hypothetical protein [Secundilactobacillus kimchicus]|uniref:hypothetical protein n=1 Tax=Secundilactobacillus kimchicus TaxID=528209 RepID=UPI0024A8C397|nr:hypothetical protein [Secundilactobacillus kimchicus]
MRLNRNARCATYRPVGQHHPVQIGKIEFPQIEKLHKGQKLFLQTTDLNGDFEILDLSEDERAHKYDLLVQAI